MALDFPASPTTGQSFTSAGSTWTWDGIKWVGASGAVGITGAPANGQWAQWSGADTITGVSTAAMPFVETAGDTMSGDLIISKTTPQILLWSATNDVAGLSLGVGSSTRWTLQKSATAESGSNVGSDFILNRYSDAGSPNGAALNIARSTGLMTVIGDPTAPLGVATKQYVDAGSGGAAARINNILYNAGMEVSQERGSNFTVTGLTSSAYIVDGVQAAISGPTITIQQQALTVGRPAGLSYSARLNVTTAVASPTGAQQLGYQFPVEGTRIVSLGFGASAQNITVGFWITGNRTGTYCASIRNGSTNRSYVWTFTINATNIWEYKTKTFLADGSGIWATDSSVGLYLNITLMSGPTFNAPAADTWTSGGGGNFISVAGMTNGAAAATDTFQVTGVYIIAGSSAIASTNAQHAVKPFAEELAACERYYEKSFVYSIVPATNVPGQGEYFFQAVTAGATNGRMCVQYRTRKRAGPTVTIYNPGAANNQVRNANTSVDSTSTTGTSGGSETTFSLNSVNEPATAVGHKMIFHWVADARL